jgi:hypothetical protein
MPSIRRHAVALACAAPLLLAPHPAAAQNRVLTTAIGALAGVGSGGYITLTLVVARAQLGHYIHDVDDLFGWQSAPVLVGGATGATLGFVDPGRLLRTAVGGTAGGLLGVGVGIVVGPAISERPEAKWAGAAIGAGAGLALGSVIGILWPAPSNDDGEGGEAGSRAAVPVGITLRF